MKKFIIYFFLLTCFFSLSFHTVFANEQSETKNEVYLEKKTTDNPYKTWHVTFSQPIHESSLQDLKYNIMVANKKTAQLVPIKIDVVSKTELAIKSDEKYDYDTYVILIRSLQSETNQTLKTTVMEFTVQPSNSSSTLSDLNSKINLPKTQLVYSQNGTSEKEAVEWDTENIKQRSEKENVYYISGQTAKTKQPLTHEIILDELYLDIYANNLLAILPPDDGETDVRGAKVSEFLFKQVLKNNGVIDKHKLIQGHLSGAINETLVNVGIEKYLTTYLFDSSNKHEKQIAACLSSAFTSHIFGSLSEAPAKYKSCMEDISDYLYDTFEISPSDLDTVEVDQLLLQDASNFTEAAQILRDQSGTLEGYWLVSYSSGGKTLMHLTKSEMGNYVGEEYLTYNSKETWQVSGSVNHNNRLTLRSYFTEEAYKDEMKISFGISNPKYWSEYKFYFESIYEINNYRQLNGKHTTPVVSRSTGAYVGQSSSKSVSMKKVPAPQFKWHDTFLQDEYHDYLDELVAEGY